MILRLVSCMTKLADGSIGVYFERQDNRKMSFTKFSIDWLEKGE